MYGPVSNLYNHQFKMNYYNSPQQMNARFWGRCQPEMFNAAQAYTPILPQVDGLDINPHDETSGKEKPFSGVPFQEFSVKQVGFKIRAHTLNHAIDRADIYRLSYDYRSALSEIFAASAARFKDRVLLYNVDQGRNILNGLTPTAHNTSTEVFPATNKYYIAAPNTANAAVEGYLDLETLIHMNTRFKMNEIYGMGDPLCVASPVQIQNLLTENKVISSDYNTIKTLTRGEVNNFMGFTFEYCRMAQALTATPSLYAKTAFSDRADLKNVATADYSQVTTKPEKIVFSLPYAALCCGEIGSASYMHVRENWDRNGVWEYLMRLVVGYRLKQTEYVQIAYAKKGTVPTQVSVRTTPTKEADYYDHFNASASNYDFTATAA